MRKSRRGALWAKRERKLALDNVAVDREDAEADAVGAAAEGLEADRQTPGLFGLDVGVSEVHLLAGGIAYRDRGELRLDGLVEPELDAIGRGGERGAPRRARSDERGVGPGRRRQQEKAKSGAREPASSPAPPEDTDGGQEREPRGAERGDTRWVMGARLTGPSLARRLPGTPGPWGHPEEFSKLTQPWPRVPADGDGRWAPAGLGMETLTTIALFA